MRDIFIERLIELAKENPDIIMVTGDLGFGVLTKFQEQLPGQFINAGVAEQNMTGLAAGLALSGKIVFTYSIGNFPTLRCLEQIRNDACYHGANVKIVSIGGGFSYGALGISHHATEDLSIMRALPEITAVVPGDAREVVGATEAVVETTGTCYLRLDKSMAATVTATDEPFRLGKARTLRRGDDMTLIAAGGILGEALAAAEDLAGNGIQCRVLSMHTLKPLDEDAVFSACSETGGIVTIEENTVAGGLGGAVAETCLEGGFAPRCFGRIGLRAGFSCIVGSQNHLRRRYGMDAASISNTVRKLIAARTEKPRLLGVK
jgi:transketolase